MNKSNDIYELMDRNLRNQKTIVELIKNDFHINAVKYFLDDAGIEIREPNRFNLNELILSILLPDSSDPEIEFRDYYNQVLEQELAEYRKEKTKKVDEIALDVYFKIKSKLRKHEMRNAFRI